MNQTGWPWFGDEMELLINAAGPPEQCTPKSTGVVGNETEWQMVLNLEKSRKPSSPHHLILTSSSPHPHQISSSSRTLT